MNPLICRQCGQLGHGKFKSRNSYSYAQSSRSGDQKWFREARRGGYRLRSARGLYEEEQSLQAEYHNLENYVNNQNADQLRGVRQETNFSSDEFLGLYGMSEGVTSLHRNDTGADLSVINKKMAMLIKGNKMHQYNKGLLDAGETSSSPRYHHG